MTNKYNIAVALTGHANSLYLLLVYGILLQSALLLVLFALLQDNIKMRHFVAVNAAKNSKSLL